MSFIGSTASMLPVCPFTQDTVKVAVVDSCGHIFEEDVYEQYAAHQIDEKRITQINGGNYIRCPFSRKPIKTELPRLVDYEKIRGVFQNQQERIKELEAEVQIAREYTKANPSALEGGFKMLSIFQNQQERIKKLEAKVQKLKNSNEITHRDNKDINNRLDWYKQELQFVLATKNQLKLNLRNQEAEMKKLTVEVQELRSGGAITHNDRIRMENSLKKRDLELQKLHQDIFSTKKDLIFNKVDYENLKLHYTYLCEENVNLQKENKKGEKQILKQNEKIAKQKRCIRKLQKVNRKKNRRSKKREEKTISIWDVFKKRNCKNLNKR